VLDDQRADDRQLVLLVTDRIADLLLAAVEPMPAAAALGQMNQALVDSTRRGELARLALVAGLAAGLAHRALVSLTREQETLGSRLRRIRGRRLRAVARISIDPALELLNALKQHRQLRDLLQQLDHELPRRLAAAQRDRLDLILPHGCKIPCIPQEPCPASRHPLNAYEKRSIALTSNIHPAGFDELMPKTLATATVDRLLHHAHVLLTEGTDSYRLAQATAGQGVRPLP
jgi:hypothetical protein